MGTLPNSYYKEHPEARTAPVYVAWDGQGEGPLFDKNHVIEIYFRSGGVRYFPGVEGFRWEHTGGGGDVIGYRDMGTAEEVFDG